MNKTVVILSLTTAAFAASTAYLAADKFLGNTGGPGGSPLAAEGQSIYAPQRQQAATQLAEAGQTGLPDAAAAPASRSIRPEDSAQAPVAPAKQGAETDGSALFARQFLARYDDSVQRAAMLDESRTAIRRQYARLKEQLKLGEATFEQLVTLLAEESLQWQEHFSRCAVDPRCDPKDPSRRNANIDRSQEYLAVLGPDDVEAFNQFRGSIGERDQVIQLRGRLPDSNFLPEAQAERLIEVLAEERKLYHDESTQRGATLSGWGTQLGVLFYSQDSSSVAQQVAEAAQYSQRMRARAASVLTPAQLAAYVQMQDELLAQLAAYLRPPARKGSSTAARAT
ncbi:MAG TPA: hypothetical protein VFS58_15420 [Steroidobacteraceae bacterium]|nr:hypothetical protein [Steroidobacteraceae bacterium]